MNTNTGKEALEYAVELASKEMKIVKDQHGKEFFDSNAHSMRVLEEYKQPRTLELNTLTGLVDYIKSERDRLDDAKLIVHVVSPTRVELYSELFRENIRDRFATVEAILPSYAYERFYPVDEFNIKLQSVFTGAGHRDILIDFASSIHIENGSTVTDNGVSQAVTIKSGVQSLSNAIAPNPVELSPYRTFLEVEQPKSLFVFRINDRPGAALFEADGGIWKNEAIQNIKNYLLKELAKQTNISVIA